MAENKTTRKPRTAVRKPAGENERQSAPVAEKATDAVDSVTPVKKKATEGEVRQSAGASESSAEETKKKAAPRKRPAAKKKTAPVQNQEDSAQQAEPRRDAAKAETSGQAVRERQPRQDENSAQGQATEDTEKPAAPRRRRKPAKPASEQTGSAQPQEESVSVPSSTAQNVEASGQLAENRTQQTGDGIIAAAVAGSEQEQTRAPRKRNRRRKPSGKSQADVNAAAEQNDEGESSGAENPEDNSATKRRDSERNAAPKNQDADARHKENDGEADTSRKGQRQQQKRPKQAKQGGSEQSKQGGSEQQREKREDSHSQREHRTHGHHSSREGGQNQTSPREPDKQANKELIINVTSNEITIALLEDKQLVELNKEKCKTGFAVGDIYLGKVRKIMPGLNAAFVNIGHEKDAFIHYLDLGPQFNTLHKLTGQLTSDKRAPKFENLKLDQPIGKKGKISGNIQSGQSIVVQIAKEAISTKGPRLTSEISLAGRHVVLMPFSNKISVSQKIRSNEEKRRLKKIAESVLPHNYGVIIRTAAIGKSDADIANDIESLVARWETAMARMRTEQPPALLLGEMNRATTIIRDLLNGSFSSIVVDDKTMYEEIREYIKTIAPEKEKIVKHYRGKTPIYDNYDISKQIRSLFAKYVSLKKGAYLIVEHTEAMHVVDVNSGNRAKVEDDQERTAMEVNLAAAAEISRQLRLRDMGGIIVIDFIDLHRSENRNVLHQRMQDLMASDRAKHTILPISKFGLMQITRQRVRPEAIAEETETCPACGGSGTITPTVLLDQQIENKIAYYVSEKGLKFIKLRVSPFVAAFLSKGFPSKRMRWQMRYKCKIKVVSDTSTGFVETKFFDREDNELL